MSILGIILLSTEFRARFDVPNNINEKKFDKRIMLQVIYCYYYDYYCYYYDYYYYHYFYYYYL